jgi:nucleotide-binding universal stress UspA family protein
MSSETMTSVGESGPVEALQAKPTAVPTDSFAELLVAYDFSKAAATALDYAEELSRHFGSTVHLINIETPEEHAKIMRTEPRVREHAGQDVKRAFMNIETRLCAKGISCDSTLRVGNVPSVLEGAILESEPDLLALGAFGRGSSERTGLGSTATHILRYAHCPVLTVGPAVRRPGHSPSIERLVCVISAAGADHDMLQLCATIASKVGAKVELLRILPPDYHASAREEHERQCKMWSDTLRYKGIRVNWDLLYGRPEQVIPARANETRASLLIVGTTPAADNNHANLSNTLVETITKVHCPVLTVPRCLQ